LSRLRVYANEEETWRAVDWVMFETIPLLREGEAIRTAMEDLYQELKGRYGESDNGDAWWRKPYWTSFVFPEGTSPDASPISTIMETMFSGENAETVFPSAIGINCTSPAYIRTLTEQLTESMSNGLKNADDDSLLLRKPPAFVLYPDGGLVYDVVTRTWHAPKNAPSVAASGDAEGSWAKNVAQVARWAAEQEVATSNGSRPVWPQILVGGCCKSGYKEIAGLRAELL
jgi:homocysteine S-methyltransferase